MNFYSLIVFILFDVYFDNKSYCLTYTCSRKLGSTMSKRKSTEKSLANLVDRSAPDNPGDTTATTVRIKTDDLEWLRSMPEGVSYHIRQAVKHYRHRE